MRLTGTLVAPAGTAVDPGIAASGAAESLEQGRQSVAAYVVFMHYVERLLLDATGAASRAEPTEHSH